MKKLVFVLAFVLASAGVSFAQQPGGRIGIDVVLGNRPPAPREVNLMRIEEANHPNIAKAMHDVEDAMRHLQQAPDEFGGNKAQAQADLHQAWVSLRRALYYRIYQDH